MKTWMLIHDLLSPVRFQGNGNWLSRDWMIDLGLISVPGIFRTMMIVLEHFQK
jgi:hypothetical protein